MAQKFYPGQFVRRADDPGQVVGEVIEYFADPDMLQVRYPGAVLDKFEPASEMVYVNTLSDYLDPLGAGWLIGPGMDPEVYLNTDWLGQFSEGEE